MGKISELLPLLWRPDELYAVLSVKRQYADKTAGIPADQPDLKFCYDVLVDVSRSFSMVIIQLHPELRNAITIFYLVLRALDTIEDDMDISNELKKKELPIFHTRLDGKWTIDGIGKGQERALLEKFDCVSREHLKLKKEYQDVIADITEKMANGMCHFLENKVVTVADYELYCHYVAGLVGHGLTRLFACSGLEDPSIAKDLYHANQMGLFLQVQNIIRDPFEDWIEDPPRVFWPQEITNMFAPSTTALLEPEYKNRALECLNAMVTHALQFVPDCLEFLARLKEPSVFLFCAIPQVMAMAGLVELYNNYDVFKVKVKLTKPKTCKVIMNSTEMRAVLQQFEAFCNKLSEKLDDKDPSYDVTRQRLDLCFQAIKDQSARLGLGESPSYARSFLTQYPALGGKLLFDVVDGCKAFLKPAQV